MHLETQSLLAMANVDYEEYNTNLPLIKQRLGSDRISKFKSVLRKELSQTTLRKATKIAILVAMGEEVPPDGTPIKKRVKPAKN